MSNIKKLMLLIICFFCITLPCRVDAEEHRWSEWIFSVQPTCTKAGSAYRKCDIRPEYVHYEEKILPALGHDYKVSVTKATCTAPGEKKYTCSRCGDTYTEPFGEMTDHEYMITETAPSCTEAGIRTYTCKYCGKSYTESFGEAVGHKYECIEKTASSCETDGEAVFICSVCGDTYSEIIPKTGHSYGEWITDKEPTKESAGHAYAICKNNPEHKTEKTLPALKGGFDFKWNTLDTVFTVVNVSLIGLFGFILYPFFLILLWIKRKRKEAEEKMENEEI